MSTYEQLVRRYDRPCIPLDDVRAEWLPHITTQQHLLTEIREGRISLRYTRLHSQKSPPIVYLRDLAAWLDANDPRNTNQPAHQAE